jgi:hypothetical protein
VSDVTVSCVCGLCVGGVRVASGQRVGYVAQKAWIMNHTVRHNTCVKER